MGRLFEWLDQIPLEGGRFLSGEVAEASNRLDVERGRAERFVSTCQEAKEEPAGAWELEWLVVGARELAAGERQPGVPSRICL